MNSWSKKSEMEMLRDHIWRENRKPEWQASVVKVVLRVSANFSTLEHWVDSHAEVIIRRGMEIEFSA